MQTLREKIKSMSGYDIVMAMINGLKKEHVKISMETFGDALYDKQNGFYICFGCAATNAVCEIAGRSYDYYNIFGPYRSKFMGIERAFLDGFESAIDTLRRGDIVAYNEDAVVCGFAILPVPEKELPVLLTENYKENLIAYEEYAETLKNGNGNN